MFAEAVWDNLVVYGVLQIRRTRKIYFGKNHTLKRCTTRTNMNGAGGYCNTAVILQVAPGRSAYNSHALHNTQYEH